VVDDQSDAASLLKRSLEMLGASVLVASSAESAWLQLELTPFDILISDIGMPELNGFDLIKTWRSKERMLGRRPMPAIALTAYGTREDRSEILEAGYTAHLAKPAGLRELTETILQEITAHP
jgi:CheY-like chemotaxis protein